MQAIVWKFFIFFPALATFYPLQKLFVNLCLLCRFSPIDLGFPLFYNRVADFLNLSAILSKKKS